MHGESKRNPARRIVDEVTRRRIAVLADADPRTVDRVLLGLPVRGAVGHRIAAVLLQAGLQASAADGEVEQ